MLLLKRGDAFIISVAEEREEGRPEQKIYDAAPKELWDHCTLSALFPLKVWEPTSASHVNLCT